MSESLDKELDALAELVEGLNVPFPARPAPDPEIRWQEFDRQIEGRVSRRRVLLVGGDVDEDAGALAARGASYVLACVPAGERDPLRRSQSGEKRVVDFQPLAWQELDADRHGTFDLVLCRDLAHRVTEPVTLLQALRAVTAPGGTLLIGSMMIDDPERSEYLRFIPDRFAGEAGSWLLPGRLAFRWLVEAAGFDVEAEFGEREGPRDRFPVVSGYLRATARR